MREMCRFHLTAGIMSYTALYITPCVKGGTHPFLWQHYVRRFDLMALTHMHPDHARGLVSILRLFPTQHLLTNGSPVTSDYVRDLLAAGQRWGTQHHIAPDGPRQWQWERLQVTML